jgi:hypothetical protein
MVRRVDMVSKVRTIGIMCPATIFKVIWNYLYFEYLIMEIYLSVMSGITLIFIMETASRVAPAWTILEALKPQPQPPNTVSLKAEGFGGTPGRVLEQRDMEMGGSGVCREGEGDKVVGSCKRGRCTSVAAHSMRVCSPRRGGSALI